MILQKMSAFWLGQAIRILIKNYRKSPLMGLFCFTQTGVLNLQQTDEKNLLFPNIQVLETGQKNGCSCLDLIRPIQKSAYKLL